MNEFEEVVLGLNKLARKKDPVRMAHYIYYLIKQNPKGIFIKDYIESVGKTVLFLKDVFQWKQYQTDKLKKELNILTKYIEK